MEYIVDDQKLDVMDFIEFVNKVWPGDYDKEKTRAAIKKNMKITVYENSVLVGCLRILTDGYFF